MEDDGSQILYPDASILIQTADKEISKVEQDGTKTLEKSSLNQVEKLQITQEKNISSNCVIITREDMVIITIEENGRVIAKHADGSTIMTLPDSHVHIESPQFPSVTMESNEKDTIVFNPTFSIQRTNNPSGMSFTIKKVQVIIFNWFLY